MVTTDKNIFYTVSLFQPLRCTHFYVKRLFAIFSFRSNHDLKKKAESFAILWLVAFEVVNIRAMKPF